MVETKRTEVSDSIKKIDSLITEISTATGGTTTTVVDINLPVKYEDDCFNDNYISFFSGDNAGLTSRITGYDQATRTITFADTLSAVSIGDIYGIVNSRSKWLQDNMGDFLSRSFNQTLHDVIGMEDLDGATIRAGIAKDIVYINTFTGSSGTDYPLGTPEHPVDNFDDALAIANARNTNRFHVYGSITLTQNADFLVFIGDSPDTCGIDINNQSVAVTTFIRCSILPGFIGSPSDSPCIFHECNILGPLKTSVINNDLEFYSCLLTGPVGNDGIGSETIMPNQVIMYNCFTDLGCAIYADHVDLHGCIGYFSLEKLGHMSVSESRITHVSGKIQITDSCVGGPIYISGNADVDIAPGATITVVDETLQGREKGLNTIYDSIGDPLSRTHQQNIEDIIGMEDYDGATVRAGLGKDCIYIDTDSGISGTDYPIGLSEYPVDNIDDAVLIARLRGVNIIAGRFGNSVLTEDVNGLHLIGTDSRSLTNQLIDLNGVVYGDAYFENVCIHGDAGGATVLKGRRCTLAPTGNDLTDFLMVEFEDSLIHNGGISSSRPGNNVRLFNCYSDRDISTVVPWISASEIQMLGCCGEFELLDLDGALPAPKSVVQIDGRLVLDATSDPNSILYLMGDCIVEGATTQVVNDYTPQGRAKGLTAIYDKADDIEGKVDDVIVDTTQIISDVGDVQTTANDIEGKVDDVIVDTTQIISDVGDVDTAVGVVDGKVDDLLDRGIFTLDGATDYIHATGGEQDIVVYTPPSDEKINVIKLTLAEMTQSAVFRIYVSGQEQNSGTWTHGTSPTEFFISMADMILNEEIKVSWEPTAAEGADRNIPWSVRGTR